MTNKSAKMEKITFERLLSLHKNKIVDPHMIDIYVNPVQMFQQACQDWFESSPEPEQEVVTPEEPKEPQDISNVIFKVNWKKARDVFGVSRGSLHRNCVPGVKWAGAVKNREAVVLVNLGHPMLSGFGLSKTNFVKGQKMFYSSKEAMKIFGFKSWNSIYSQYDDSETLRIGRHIKFPIALTHEKIDERDRKFAAHYDVDPISFPMEVFNENES